MQWISIILPAFLSVCVKEVLEKKEYSWLRSIKTLGTYVLLTNLLSIAVCYFVFKLVGPLTVYFDSNVFFIKYTILNIVFAILLPIFFIIISPYIQLSIELKDKYLNKRTPKE